MENTKGFVNSFVSEHSIKKGGQLFHELREATVIRESCYQCTVTRTIDTISAVYVITENETGVHIKEQSSLNSDELIDFRNKWIANWKPSLPMKDLVPSILRNIMKIDPMKQPTSPSKRLGELIANDILSLEIPAETTQTHSSKKSLKDLFGFRLNENDQIASDVTSWVGKAGNDTDPLKQPNDESKLSTWPGDNNHGTLSLNIPAETTPSNASDVQKSSISIENTNPDVENNETVADALSFIAEANQVTPNQSSISNLTRDGALHPWEDYVDGHQVYQKETVSFEEAKDQNQAAIHEEQNHDVDQSVFNSEITSRKLSGSLDGLMGLVEDVLGERQSEACYDANEEYQHTEDFDQEVNSERVNFSAQESTVDSFEGNTKAFEKQGNSLNEGNRTFDFVTGLEVMQHKQEPLSWSTKEIEQAVDMTDKPNNLTENFGIYNDQLIIDAAESNDQWSPMQDPDVKEDESHLDTLGSSNTFAEDCWQDETGMVCKQFIKEVRFLRERLDYLELRMETLKAQVKVNSRYIEALEKLNSDDGRDFQ